MRKLLLLLLIFPAAGLFAQTHQLAGFVRSKTGEPLGNANIILKKLSNDSSIVAFSLTENNGAYTLELPSTITGKLLLEASMMGYAKQERIIDAGKSHNIDFTLNTQSMVLKEVVVRDKPAPFKAKNDTTTYNLSQFSDGTERKLEDLLKKLPGVKVDENGNITFKGKAIDKIML